MMKTPERGEKVGAAEDEALKSGRRRGPVRAKAEGVSSDCVC